MFVIRLSHSPTYLIGIGVGRVKAGLVNGLACLLSLKIIAEQQAQLWQLFCK